MIKAHQHMTYSSVLDTFPVGDQFVKGHGYLATRGLSIPTNFRNLDLLSHWGRYIDRSKDLKTFLFQSMDFIRKTADDYVRRVTELCSIFFIDLDEEELDLERDKYLYLVTLGNTIPQLKYSVNYAFSLFHRAQMPAGGPDDFMGLEVFPRRLAVALAQMRARRHSKKTDNWFLMNTLFQGFKKGLLPSEPHLVQKSLDKHRVSLTQDPSISQSILDKLDRYVPQMFANFDIWENFPDTLNQSTHSTSVVGYADGGNVGYTQSLIHGKPLLNDNKFDSGITEHQYLGEPELIGFVARGGKSWLGVPVYSRFFFTLKEVLQSFPDEIFKFRLEDSDFRDFGSYLEAVPACILEPMKIRLITKPGLGLHVRMHKLQRALRSYIYRDLWDIFALTGEPLERHHLWSLIGRGFHWDEGMCSGDFSQATDLLKGEVTSRIVQLILGDRLMGRDPRLYANVLNTLQGVDILQTRTVLPKYGTKSNPCVLDNFEYKLQDFRQKNGQLMGHVVSFVILCIANYCAFWDSHERYLGKTLTFSEMRRRRPVKINGDDILFKTNSEHYNLWCNVINEYGFQQSVGKNYFSDRFLQVNSELWRIDTRLTDEIQKRLISVRKISYVNFGLLTNRKKQDCSIDASVSSFWTKFQDGALNSLSGRLAALPDIRSKLMNDIPDTFRVVVDNLFKTHCHPIVSTMLKSGEKMGVKMFERLIYNNLGIPGFDELWRECFSTGLGVEVEQRGALNDMSSYLVKSEQDSEYNRVCALLRVMSHITCPMRFIGNVFDCQNWIDRKPDEWKRV